MIMEMTMTTTRMRTKDLKMASETLLIGERFGVRMLMSLRYAALSVTSYCNFEGSKRSMNLGR